jgi:RNA polymerase-binding transcription factor DksA
MLLNIYPRLVHDSTQQFSDPGDLSAYHHDRHVEATLADVRAKEVRTQSMEEVLAQRRSHGTADNKCSDCGEEISAKRLEVRPGALRCVECESQREVVRRSTVRRR